jgi:NAD(P)-dependent dehydrogenase (short-subunit alcohol dehydrogenase family)
MFELIVLITGCSPKGLGAECARAISLYSPELLILAGRSSPTLQATVEVLEEVSPGVRFQTLELDLADQASIRNAAAKVNSMVQAIDVLINNAGIMATAFSKTIDGIESQFGTNHIGHFLFTNLIIDRLFAAKNGGRIINVTSSAYIVSGVRFDDVNFEVCST